MSEGGFVGRPHPDVPRGQMRAKGNLSYLEFIALIKRIWESAHPDIPLLPAGSSKNAQYPCINYSIDVSKTHPQDPKMRYREVLDSGEEGKVAVMTAQRFQSVVKFTVTNETTSDYAAEVADEIIEAFEDFMLEHTPVFKEMGVSEFVYARRYSDTEENRSGMGVVVRSVGYMLTTEKVRKTDRARLESILIDARMWLRKEVAVGGRNNNPVHDQPRYYRLPGQYPLITATDAGSTDFYIEDSYFRIGDVIYVTNIPGWGRPPVSPGYYIIFTADEIDYKILKLPNPHLLEGEEPSDTYGEEPRQTRHQLLKLDKEDDGPVAAGDIVYSSLHPLSRGWVMFITDGVNVNIHDHHATKYYYTNKDDS